jgi:NAD(P)H-nitrite reductase large subunit
MTNDPVICGCNDVHRSAIERAIRGKGLRTAEQINKEFHLDRSCGACKDGVQTILKEFKGR